MATKSLTAANAGLTLAFAGIFTTPQQIQGFGTDDAFATEAIDFAETMMGVDGKMSSGYMPNIVPLTVTLQADSVSNDIMDRVAQTQRAKRQLFRVDGTLSIPSLGAKFTLSNGVLKSAPLFAASKKVLQPRNFVFHFENITGAPF